MASGYGNVYFIGVARIGSDAVVVANYSYHSEIDIDGVKKVLDEPNLSLLPGKYYTFTSNQFGWHLVSGECCKKYL